MSARRRGLVAGLLLLVPSPAFAQRTELAGVSSTGRQGDHENWAEEITPDGRFVLLNSISDNLVLGDTNGAEDVFVHDRSTGLTELVSVDSSGAQSNNNSYGATISKDGRIVAFESFATNLVAGDTNAHCDVFVHERTTGITRRVSELLSGVQGNGDSRNPRISADGHFVAFCSNATNLVSNDWNGAPDVFVADLTTRIVTCVSVDHRWGGTGNWESGQDGLDISSDGRFVAFESFASDLVRSDLNNTGDVFVHDRLTRSARIVSVDSSGGAANSRSYYPAISADGRIVAFETAASNLVPGDTNANDDIFVHDWSTGLTQRVSVDSSGAEANFWSGWCTISADGNVVGFTSGADNLVSGDDNHLDDVFVHDRTTGLTERVSVDTFGREENNSSFGTWLSGDGRLVLFDSYADNLVFGDRNGTTDAFLRIR